MASSRKKIPATCNHCGAHFLASEANIERGNGRFCSKSCGAKSRAMTPERLKVLMANLVKGHVKGAGHREVARAWRHAHPERFRAHLAVSAAIKRGKLIRLPCEVCGDPNTHGHHEDYSKRLEVVWLCPKHHSEVHRAGE